MSHTTDTSSGAPAASSNQAAVYPLTIKPYAYDWWKPPLRFVVESITGVFLFGVVAGAAVGVSIYLHYLERQGVDAVIAYGLQAAEYALFVADLVLFARFLWKSSLRTWQAL
jgi:hypothetical protein